jgi:3-deoxy-7-phosphoheptulonate synthase
MSMKYETDDLRIASIKAVTPPREVCEEIPITEQSARTTWEARNAIHAILAGEDDRLMVVAGPCSIHDPVAALEYARRLLALKQELQRELLIIMRVYFEKPRTTVGWKGLINDPDLDGSFHINKGLRLARQLLRDLNEMGMPAGTEFLDIITPQYVTDLVSWGAIGARTTESQVHREVASGLSCPVGFKNGTDGTTQIAVDAIRAASVPHNFLSLRKEGNSAIFITRGNPDCHIILRGGRTPNYDAASIARVAGELERAKLPAKIMVDFSHANSGKRHEQQIEVARDVTRQISEGESRIFGAMLESHLIGGRQDVVPGRKLVHGQSITDACLGWEQTEPLLRDLARAVATRRKR